MSEHMVVVLDGKFQSTSRAVHELSVSSTAANINSQQGEQASGSNWPNFTLSHFHLRTQEALKSSGAEVLAFAPLVQSSHKEEWEAYAQDHQDWLPESLEDAGLGHIHPGPAPTSIQSIATDNETTITSSSSPSQIQHQYVPLWQMEPTPINATVLLQDLHSLPWFRLLAHDAVFTNGAVISSTVDVSFLKSDGHVDYNNPHSIILDLVRRDFQKDGEEDGVVDVVGFVLADIPWQYYFTELLPEGTDGFIIAVKDTCGAHFTFEVNGKEAAFLGMGDLHESEYDYLMESYHVSAFDHAKNNNTTHDDHNDGIHCVYDIDIYPSDELREKYETHRPLLFGGAVIMIFFSTALVFFIYDCAVERRQNEVLATATRTTAIVSSLFPKNVQARLLKDAEDQAEQELKNTNKRAAFGAKHRLKDFMGGAGETNAADDDIENANVVQPETPPIADLFPNATIMFAGTFLKRRSGRPLEHICLCRHFDGRQSFHLFSAFFFFFFFLSTDIVGFTAWSCEYMLMSRTWMPNPFCFQLTLTLLRTSTPFCRPSDPRAFSCFHSP